MASTSAKVSGKRSRATAEQMRMMVDPLHENPGLATGRFQRLHGKLEQQKKWKEVADKLNLMGGATKTPEQWQNVWRDLKTRTSNRVRERNNETARTGNRPVSVAPLNELELRIVALIGDNYIEGASTCQDSEDQPQNVMYEEHLELSGSDEEPAPPTPTAARATTATPGTPLQTPRQGPRRRHQENMQERLIKIAESQAESMRMLASVQEKQEASQAVFQEKLVDAMLTMARAVTALGEGVKECTKSFDRLCNAIIATPRE